MRITLAEKNHARPGFNYRRARRQPQHSLSRSGIQVTSQAGETKAAFLKDERQRLIRAVLGPVPKDITETFRLWEV